MRGGPLRIAAALVAATLVASGCGQAALDGAPNEEPAHVEEVAGQAGLHRITLTQKAAERLGIVTVEVGPAGTGAGRTRVPYSAVIYDADGAAWAYVADEDPLAFVRHALAVDSIVASPSGDYAILSEGPEVGTPVVTVGVAELFGTEFEVGH